jgi:hypothetical protein
MSTKTKYRVFIGALIGIIFLIIWGLNAAFSTSPEKEFKKSPADTLTTTIALAVDAVTNDYRFLTVMKISKDSFAVGPDSVKLEWRRETVYEIPMKYAVKDSTGNPVLDGAGQPVVRRYQQAIDKRLILEDFNRAWEIKWDLK